MYVHPPHGSPQGMQPMALSFRRLHRHSAALGVGPLSTRCPRGRKEGRNKGGQGGSEAGREAPGRKEGRQAGFRKQEGKEGRREEGKKGRREEWEKGGRGDGSKRKEEENGGRKEGEEVRVKRSRVEQENTARHVEKHNASAGIRTQTNHCAKLKLKQAKCTSRATLLPAQRVLSLETSVLLEVMPSAKC